MRLRSGCLLFVGMALVLFGVFVVVVTSLIDGSDTDCTIVRLPTAARFAALPPGDQVDLIGDLELCSRYDGRTEAEIRAALGPPAERGTDGNGALSLRYEVGEIPADPDGTGFRRPDALDLTFDAQGRVTDTNIQHAT